MSLAFLDVMFCGFGATILLFLIIDHASTVNAVETNPDITAVVNLLQEEVRDVDLGVVQLRKIFSDSSLKMVTAEVLPRQI